MSEAPGQPSKSRAMIGLFKRLAAAYQRLAAVAHAAHRSSISLPRCVMHRTQHSLLNIGEQGKLGKLHSHQCLVSVESFFTPKDTSVTFRETRLGFQKFALLVNVTRWR